MTKRTMAALARIAPVTRQRRCVSLGSAAAISPPSVGSGGAASPLGDKGVKTLDDLADLASDELIEIVQNVAKPSQDEANAIIMAARAHWFADGETTAVASAGAAAAPAEK